MYLIYPLSNSIIAQYGKDIQDFFLINSASMLVIFISFVILLAFILLFGRQDGDNRRLYIAFGLVIIATPLVSIISPYKDWNALITAALLTPIYAYCIDLLKEKQKFSSEKDKLVWEYKCRQLQIESDMLSNLLGELSTHAAVFKSPFLQPVEVQKWVNSFKANVIAESHALSISRYYTYVIQYNEIISKLNLLFESKKNDTGLPDISSTIETSKKAFLRAETFVYFMKLYDLSYLQQNYLKRPKDDFPLHENLLFRKYLEASLIVQKNDETIIRALDERGAKRFNKKIVIDLNDCFDEINIYFDDFKTFLKKYS